MTVSASVINEITVSIENNYEFRVAFCCCKGRRVKGILGILVLDVVGAMVIMQNNFWSAVLLICLKKHHLTLNLESCGIVTWESGDLGYDLSASANYLLL